MENFSLFIIILIVIITILIQDLRLKYIHHSHFEPIQELGRGSFGVVFETKYKIDDRHYAVKQILFKEESRDILMREKNALAKLEHPGIVGFYNSWLETSSSGQDNLNQSLLFIQMELCQKETLREWLRNVAQRVKVVVFDFFAQTVSAVAYLHGKGLMHLDLKPSNILFSMDGDIKISDFCWVTEANDVDELYSTPESEMKEFRSKQHTKRVGTKLYMSPEQIYGEPYSNKVDIFSLGVIFYEMLNYFNTEMERKSTLKNIRKRIVPKEFEEKFQSEYLLLMQMLAFYPNQRPTAEMILQNEIFKGVQTPMEID